MLITIIAYVNYVKIKDSTLNKDMFNNKWSNSLYLVSYSFPLKYLLEEKEELSKKEKSIEEDLNRLNLTDCFNLRSFLALRFIILFTSLLSLYVVVEFIKLFKEGYSILQNPFLVIPFLFVSLLPNIYLKIREKQYKAFYYDEVVTLQLFMILFIESNATIEEVLFAFSKMNTFHKKTFEKAYRIALRSKKDALEYLEIKFEDIALGNSFNVLSNMFEYSKDTSVMVLKSNLKKLEEDSMNKRRKDELGKFSFSQVSMVVPFLVSVLLGAMPVLYYGTTNMMEMMKGL